MPTPLAMQWHIRSCPALGFPFLLECLTPAPLATLATPDTHWLARHIWMCFAEYIVYRSRFLVEGRKNHLCWMLGFPAVSPAFFDASLIMLLFLLFLFLFFFVRVFVWQVGEPRQREGGRPARDGHRPSPHQGLLQKSGRPQAG